MFGKLPALGDFVSRGLDFGLRDALDTWLSAQIEQARARFGASFEARWFGAPAWCFVDADPDGQWSGGALCASMDSAGRKFPLMLALPADGADEAAALAGGCLEALYLALGQGWTADQLHAAPITPAMSDWRPGTAAWAMPGEQGAPLVEPGRYPPAIVTQMLEVAG